METSRGLDAIWMTQFLAAFKHMVANGYWFSLDIADDLTSMIASIDKSAIHLRHLPPRRLPATRHLKALLGDGAIDGPQLPLANLLRSVEPHLHWQQNPNYVNDPLMADFVSDYGYVEIVGINGHAYSENVALGLMVIGPEKLYPHHQHESAELYYVFNGSARFQRERRPWQNWTVGSYVVHRPWVSHATQTRTEPLIALYLWHGKVNEYATLVPN